MVNSPVASTADSASGWSSPGVAQPPRVPSRSLLTVPPGVVEHPHAVLRRPLLVIRSCSEAVRGRPIHRLSPCDADARSTGSRVTPRPSLITTGTARAAPSSPEHPPPAPQPAPEVPCRTPVSVDAPPGAHEQGGRNIVRGRRSHGGARTGAPLARWVSRCDAALPAVPSPRRWAESSRTDGPGRRTRESYRRGASARTPLRSARGP